MSSLTVKPLISLLLFTFAAASVIHDTFTVVESLADKVCPIERRLLEVKATNTLSCLAKAGRRSECTGVSYDGHNQKCYICDTYQDTIETFPTLIGATFYYRSKVLPAGYTDIVDGHALNIMSGLAANHSQVVSACTDWAGSALVKIDTAAKQEAIRAIVMDPANGYGGNLWVQGNHDSTDGVWKFDDGTPVPMTQEIWAPNQPDFATAECAYMAGFLDFYWDNRDCDYPMGYICEVI